MEKFEERDKEAIEIVLKEIIEEHQKANAILTEQNIMIKTLLEEVKGFDEKLGNIKVIGPPVSIKAFEEGVKKIILENRIANNNESKIANRKLQILLFPEQDAKLFYKIVFGRWLIWLTIMLLINNIYKMGINWSNNQKEIQLRNVESDRIKKAWNYRYFEGNKSVKRLMDSAYNKGIK